MAAAAQFRVRPRDSLVAAADANGAWTWPGVVPANAEPAPTPARRARLTPWTGAPLPLGPVADHNAAIRAFQRDYVRERVSARYFSTLNVLRDLQAAIGDAMGADAVDGGGSARRSGERHHVVVQSHVDADARTDDYTARFEWAEWYARWHSDCLPGR